MGSISSHKGEHLMSTDRGVMMYRRRIKKLMKNLEAGEEPPQPQKIKGQVVRTNGQDTVLRAPKRNKDDKKFVKSICSSVIKMQFNVENMSLKERDDHIVNSLHKWKRVVILTDNKRVKIHIKNNHWAPGSFPCDLEGEKNFTITKEQFEKAIDKEDELKEKINFFIDWDEDNFKSSISNSDTVG